MHNTLILAITLTQLAVLAWVLFLGPWRPLVARRARDGGRRQPTPLAPPAASTPPPAAAAPAPSPTPRRASDRPEHCAAAFDTDLRRQAEHVGGVS